MTIKSFLSAALTASLVFSACQKKDVPTVQPPPPLDPKYYILRDLTQRQVNEFSIVYEITSPPLATFHDIRLYWTKNADFANADSVTLHEVVKGLQLGNYYFKRMAKYTTYKVRLGITNQGYRYYSDPVTIQTDSIRFNSIPADMSRGVTTIFGTNYVMPPDVITDTSVHLFLNGIPNPTWVLGTNMASFQPDTTLPRGKYHISLQGNGIRSEAPDSIELLGGKWSLSAGPANPTNGLYNFGTCQSLQKGYLIPGLNMYDDTLSLNRLYTFDPATESWTSENTTHAPYFVNPVCFYLPNTIYVVGGETYRFDGFSMVHEPLKTAFKLDLATLDWSILGPLPVTNRVNTQMLQINDIVFAGIGETILGLQSPEPANDFWKFDPTTDKWTRMADMPRTHSENQPYPSSFVIGGKGYLYYGDIPRYGGRELWSYDTSTNTWTNIPLSPAATPEPGERYLVTIQNGNPCFIGSQLPFYSATYDPGKHMEIDLTTGKSKNLARNPRDGAMQAVFSKGKITYAMEPGPNGKFQKFEYE